MRVPHPVPYQGSKRLLAPAILRRFPPSVVRRLYEPFAGSAAITLAAAQAGCAESFVVGDSLAPLVALWRAVLDDPVGLARRYERLWERGDYHAARARYNDGAGADAAPLLLYLLARCVKSAARWNRAGAFNQAPDHRRRGARPPSVSGALAEAHSLLAGRTELRCGDFADALADAGPDDLVYLDPPWQGVSGPRDARYHQGLSRARLVEVLADLDRRGVPYLVSYDGRCGDRTYGEPLALPRIDLPAGRSAQSTLAGRSERTVESLYVSPLLVRR